MWEFLKRIFFLKYLKLNLILVTLTLKRLVWPGNTNWSGRLIAVELLIKVACFVKKYVMFVILKAANLNLLIQGGQSCWAFPFSKDSLVLQTITLKDKSGRAKANWREPKSCLGWVFNSKLGRIATLLSKCWARMLQPLLELKTRPRALPVS